MDDCIFCKIANNELPCNKIAETENFLAFLDIRPINPGHILVIPKKHSTNFLDMPEYLGNEFIALAQRVAQAMLAGTEADGFNIGLNNGPAAGQVVFHTHFHIIPRLESDGLSAWPGKDASDEERAALAEKIVAKLRD